METTLRWIVLAPLLGATLNGLLNRRLPRRHAGWLGCASVAVSFALSLRAVLHLAGLPADARQLTDTVMP